MSVPLPTDGVQGAAVGAGGTGRAVRTSWGSATDRGRVRALNEDSLIASPPVFAVADGMGGHQAGDLASRLAVEELASLAGRAVVTPKDVAACLTRTAQRLRATVGEGTTAGTTVAGVVVTTHDGAPAWIVVNIGDSRVYRFSGGVLEQVSVDHSLVQELVDRGGIDAAEARDHPHRHVITRAVGTGPDPEPDLWLIPAAAGDRMLVCSDGLTGELEDAALRAVLAAEPDPQAAAERLVADALDAGGGDNITAVVVDLASDEPLPPGAVATDRPTTEDGEADGPTEDTLPPGARVEPGADRRPGAPRDEASHRTSPDADAPADAWDEDVDGVTVPRPTRRLVPEVRP